MDLNYILMPFKKHNFRELSVNVSGREPLAPLMSIFFSWMLFICNGGSVFD